MSTQDAFEAGVFCAIVGVGMMMLGGAEGMKAWPWCMAAVMWLWGG